VRLYAMSRRVPFAMLAIAACAIGLRIALLGHWDAYGALQLPLIFEAAAAVSVVATVASPFGEPERVAGRWLPYVRLAVTAALTAAAIGLLAAAGTGANLSGGTLDVLRNVAGITGIGLLCAAALGSGLSWTGPTGYLVAAVYALYTQWHPPALTHDLAAPSAPCWYSPAGSQSSPCAEPVTARAILPRLNTGHPRPHGSPGEMPPPCRVR